MYEGSLIKDNIRAQMSSRRSIEFDSNAQRWGCIIMYNNVLFYLLHVLSILAACTMCTCVGSNSDSSNKRSVYISEQNMYAHE